MGISSGTYISMADRLLAGLRRNDSAALQRLRAYVPRHATATSAATAELRDARLITTRESGFLTRLPPTDDPEEIVGEAFVHACQHGRIEVMRWFLDRGVHPDVAPYLGRTGLHWAIPGDHVEVIRLLLERGADPSIRDDLFQIDADGWLHMSHAARPHDPVTRQLHDLIEARAR